MSSARPILLAAALALPAFSGCSGCARPEPPTVTPLSGKVTGISSAGIDVDAKLEAYNPNDFDIAVKSFTATVTLDHQYTLPNVGSAHAVTLPALKKKVFEVPISVKWSDVSTLVPLGLSNRDVPFDAEGKVRVTAASLDVDLPFKVSGVVTHQQIVQAVGRSMPRLPF
jgi:LEA14-like dessication related protein